MKRPLFFIPLGVDALALANDRERVVKRWMRRNFKRLGRVDLHGPVRQRPSRRSNAQPTATAGREKACKGRRRSACPLVLVEKGTQDPCPIGERSHPQCL